MDFINELCEADEKDKHIGQNPMFTRGDLDIEEIIIDGDEGE